MDLARGRIVAEHVAALPAYVFAGCGSAQAVFQIAVDSKYWLWVNGKLIVREGGLKRGPTPRDSYCDHVDLSPHLKAGINTLAVLVWYWGVDGSSHLSSGQGGLLVDGDGVAVVSGRGVAGE